jgi:hypothetical protein
MTSTASAAATAANRKDNQGTNNNSGANNSDKNPKLKKQRRNAFTIMCDKAEKLTAPQKIELVALLKASLERERKALQDKLELITNQSL